MTTQVATRLVVAAKNYVAISFLGAYLLFLGGVWTFFFQRAWHAVFHAAVLGCLAHMLLQLMAIVSPAVPFATEPRRGQQSSKMLGVLFAGTVVAPLVSIRLPYVYTSGASTALLAAALAVVTALLEYVLRLRMAEAVKDVEFAA